MSDEDRIRYGGPKEFGLIDRIQSISTRQLFVKHSFTSPINPSTAFILTSQVVARQGVGAGNFILKITHNPTSTLNFEIGTTVLRPRALTFKTTYAPDSDSFVRLELNPIRDLTFPHPPRFNLTLGRRIYENLTCICTLRSGAYALGSWGSNSTQPVSDSTLSVGLQHTNGLACEVTSGVFTQQLTAGWDTTVLSGFRIGLNGVVTSTGAASVGWSVDRRITENVKGGLGLEVAVNGAMTLKLRYALPSFPSTLSRQRLTAFVQVYEIGTKNHFTNHCGHLSRPKIVHHSHDPPCNRYHYNKSLLARS